MATKKTARQLTHVGRLTHVNNGADLEVLPAKNGRVNLHIANETISFNVVKFQEFLIRMLMMQDSITDSGEVKGLIDQLVRHPEFKDAFSLMRSQRQAQS